MKNRTSKWFVISFLATFCLWLDAISGPNNDVHTVAEALLVCNDSSVVCNEKVVGNVCVKGPVSYQTCFGTLFPLISEKKGVKSVRGALCYSTGGVNVPESFANYSLFPVSPGVLVVLPLFIKSLGAKIAEGCGFVHSSSIIQGKVIANFLSEFLVPVELSTRIEFSEAFCEVPSVAVSYNSQSNELLLPCTIQNLNVQDPDFGPIDASAVWVNAEAYAGDVTRTGFTLTVLFYISIGADNELFVSSQFVKLNRFINQLINKSGVSFLAEGKVAQSKKCC